MMHLYRIARYLYKHRIPFLPKIIQGLIFLLFNSRITPDTIIGKGTYFAYRGVSSVLVSGTVIGNNCVLGLRFSTVRKFPYKNVPKLGNDIYVGPNVVIMGPVIVEDNVIIAANSVVNRSVPAGGIVGGIPAKIIGHIHDLEYDIFSNPKYKEGYAEYLTDKK
ncbi:serine O-acetyltransferase [Limibacterium fermenti]|uniref:serine O-acetyltransferase n=1 Tax=Limibacterium fermenti TaxID=3229863 RepID=UPI003A64DE13